MEATIQPIPVELARSRVWLQAPIETCCWCGAPTGKYGNHHGATCQPCRNRMLIVKERRKVAQTIKAFGPNAPRELGWVD